KGATEFRWHEKGALGFALFDIHPTVNRSDLASVAKRFKTLAQVFKGVSVFGKYEELFVTKVRRLHQLAQFAEFRFVERLSNRFPERDDALQIFEFLLELGGRFRWCEPQCLVFELFIGF